MNIHLMMDSSYTNNFIEYLNENNELKENKVVVIHLYQIKHICKENLDKVTMINRKPGYFKSSKEFKQLCDLITSEDRVFAHYLTTEAVWVINNIDAKEYNWSLWGGDFYPYIKQEQYDQETLILREKYCSDKSKSIKTKLQEYISYRLRKKAINKIDNVFTWNDYDYDLLCSKFTTKAKLKYLTYPGVNNYTSLDDIIKSEYIEKSDLTIQLGNSGDSTNNHITILKKLAKYKDKGFKVIVPLSYGEEWYIDEVIKIGQNLLGDKFVPLTEFVSLEEYRKILSTVDIAIMNHLRQQGVGNIASLIYLGKKVYLNKEVTTYKSFKDWGIKLYNTSDLLNEEFEQFSKLDKEHVESNREIIKNKFNNNVEF